MAFNLMNFRIKLTLRADISSSKANINTKLGLRVREKLRPQRYEPATVSIEMLTMESKSASKHLHMKMARNC